MGGLPGMRHRFRVHAHRRRLRQRFLRLLLLILVVIAAAFVLRFILSLGNHVPNFYEPRDLEREKLLKEKK